MLPQHKFVAPTPGNQQGTMFPEVMGIQGPMPHIHPQWDPPGPKWSKKSAAKNVSLPEIVRHHKKIWRGVVVVWNNTTINDLNPNSSAFLQNESAPLRSLWWVVACGSNEKPGPKRIRHTLVAASRANAPPKLCPVKIKSQSLGTALKRPRSAAVLPSFRSPPPKLRERPISQKERNSWLQFGTICRVFFCKGKNKPRKSTWNWKSPNWRGKPIWTKASFFFGGVYVSFYEVHLAERERERAWWLKRSINSFPSRKGSI